MEAATLHCPDCGAPASPEARACGYCHARLATVACPHCFGLAFVGMKHCPSCGAVLQREKVPDAAAEVACPRCSGALEPVRIGPTLLRECAGCGGAWLDNPTFLALCEARDRQAEILARHFTPRYTVAGGMADLPVTYLHCPVCRALMSRLNFAFRSGVLVDVCRAHGTWFDAGDLHRVVQFVVDGGVRGSDWSQVLIHFTPD